MSTQEIIKEAMNKNPSEMKKKVEEELRNRIAVVLEKKMKNEEDDDGNDDDGNDDDGNDDDDE